MARDYKNLFSDLGTGFIKSDSPYESVKKSSKNSGAGSHFFNRLSNSSGFDNRARKESITAKEEIDRHIKAKKTESYVFRAFNNNSHKMLVNDFKFLTVSDLPLSKKKIELLRKYFMIILFKSGYTFESFVEEIIKNAPHGNVFIHKTYIDGFVGKYTVMPVTGWEAKSHNGFDIEEYDFHPGERISSFSTFGENKKTYKKRDIIHLKFNFETGELFGSPLLNTAIDDIALLRDIETADANNYIDASQSKPYIRVGDTQYPGASQEINDIDEYFQNTSEDDIPIFNGKANFGLLSHPRVSGSELIENFKNRMFAATGASKTSMGSDKLGRQTADIDSENEDITVSSLQIQICNQLNQKLFLELNQTLFPDCYDLDEVVKIVPNKPFNIKERTEKHNLLLWQGGGISQKEYEKRMGYSLDIKTCYPKLFEAEPTNQGSVSQSSSPSNQYGKKTSSKPSVKN